MRFTKRPTPAQVRQGLALFAMMAADYAREARKARQAHAMKAGEAITSPDESASRQSSNDDEREDRAIEQPENKRDAERAAPTGWPAGEGTSEDQASALDLARDDALQPHAIAPGSTNDMPNDTEPGQNKTSAAAKARGSIERPAHGGDEPRQSGEFREAIATTGGLHHG